MSVEAYDVTTRPELLSHVEHLPETITCSCGYVRPEDVRRAA